MAGHTIDVSVVISTWNRCRLLRQTLEQLTHLDVPSGTSWEVIVVNNNCNDDTEDVIAEFFGRLPVRSVFERSPGASHARNRGIAEARGEWLLFTDDDVLVDPGWLRAVVEVAWRWPDAAVVGGPIAPWFVSEPPTAILEAFPIARGGFCQIDHGPDERPLQMDEHVYGANMAFRATALVDHRFDPRLGPIAGRAITGEELELIGQIRQSGGRVVWCPTMRVRHYVDPARLTPGYLANYYRDHARTLIRLGARPPGRGPFGVPRWLWRATLSSYVRARWSRLRRTPDHLVRLREFSNFFGMWLECRATPRKPDLS